MTEKSDLWNENGDGNLSTIEPDEAERISGFGAKKVVKFYDTGGAGLISLRETHEVVSRPSEVQALVP